MLEYGANDNTKKKITLFPYSRNSIPLVNYFAKFRPEYEISHLVSPHGLGLSGKDASFADNRKSMHMIVGGDLNEALSQDDVLFIAEGRAENPDYPAAEDSINLAISNRKEIICAAKLEPKTLTQIKAKCEVEKTRFQYAVYDEWASKYQEIIKSDYDSQDFSAPSSHVIFVGQLADYSNTYEVFLMLVYRLRKSGYRVSGIGDAQHCELMGLHSMPSFLKGVNCREQDKITYFNHFVQLLDKTEHPDFIVIQIPEGMMRYSQSIPNGFGVYAFLISQAVQPDYFICTMPYVLDKTYIKNISDGIANRFGYQIDAVHISNIILDNYEMNQNRSLSLIHISEEELDAQLAKIRCNENNIIAIYDLLNEIDPKLLFQSIENETKLGTIYSVI